VPKPAVYPNWAYFPRNTRAPEWAEDLVGIVEASHDEISTAVAKGPTSDNVLAAIATGLKAAGYLVEADKTKIGKIGRPVLFGNEGKAALTYEVDAFHPDLRLVIEVEAGRGAMNNADYRDIIRSSLILDADFFALLMPLRYRFQGGPKDGVRAYENTCAVLDAIYASRRLVLPFTGVLVVGY